MWQIAGAAAILVIGFVWGYVTHVVMSDVGYLDDVRGRYDDEDH